MKRKAQTRRNRTIPLACSVILGVPAVGLPALAQEAAPPAAPATSEPEKMEKVIVTGSNIPTAETVAVAPVDVLSSAAIEKTGAADFETLAKKLPSTVGAGNFGMSRGNGGNGTTQIALRGIPGGTLVLINGRRTANQDLNAIPMAAIDRIEILKDGGSSIYGADAVAGVVNVILKKDFQGAEVSARYGNTTQTDAAEQVYSFVTGTANEKTSVLIGGDYYKANSLYSVDRARSRPNYSSQSSYTRNTSGTSNPGRIISTQGTAQFPGLENGLVYSGPVGTTPTTPSQFVPYSSSVAAGHRFPYPNYTPAIRDSERYSVFGSGEHQFFGENLKFFTDAFYTHSYSYNQLAPTPIVFSNNTTPTSPNGIVIPANNPYNVFGVPIDNAFYRPVELGPRTDSNEYDIVRFVGGLRGRVADTSWNWEAATLYTQQKGVNTQGNDISRTGLEQAVNSTDPATAFNPFGNQANSAAVLDTIRLDHYTFDRDELFQVDGKVNGEVFELPGGPLALAVGGEFRNERSTHTPDGTLINGDVVGFNGDKPYSGSRDVYAGYYEVNIPIFGQDMNVPVFHRFEVNTSGRYENYSDFGDTFKPKVGVMWKPFDESLMLRASYSESFTAPGFGDLYAADQESYPELRNPVKYAKYQAAVAAGDQANIDKYSSYFEQIRTFYSGNPDLKPTEAKNYTAGIVYTPPWVKTITLTADYFRIEQENVPGSVDQYILDQNYQSGGPLDPNAKYANLVAFNPATEQYNLLLAPTLNLSQRIIEGIDWSATHQLATDNYGTFTTTVAGTYYLTFEQENIPGDGLVDRLGDFVDPSQSFGLGSLPRLKLTGSLFWSKGNFEAGLTGNYICSYLDDYQALGYNREISDYLTFDLQASYRLPWDAKITAGVINVTDEEPPLVVAAFADNYDRDTADLRGRFVYIQASKKF